MSLNNGSSYRKKGNHIWSFPQYQSLSEVYGCPFVHKSYMSDYFSRSSGLFHHDLIGHYGCVNAIEFSNNGGEFIVSGRYHTESYSGFCCQLLIVTFLLLSLINVITWRSYCIFSYDRGKKL